MASVCTYVCTSSERVREIEGGRSERNENKKLKVKSHVQQLRYTITGV